jgi:hypothetical protein
MMLALGAHSETEKVTGGRRRSSEAAWVEIMGQNTLVQTVEIPDFKGRICFRLQAASV